jgi:LysR family hydrogen peroxide-inducible transcriptional activator
MLPYDCGAVEGATLVEDPFVVVFPAAHAFPRQHGVRPQNLSSVELLLLKDGPACASTRSRPVIFRMAPGRLRRPLPTLVQMMDNGLGTTILPRLAVDARLHLGTNLVTRLLLSSSQFDPVREEQGEMRSLTCTIGMVN